MPTLNGPRPGPGRALSWTAALVVVGTALYFWLRVSLTVTPTEALNAGNELLKKKTVLAVVAHPDDLEWYIGGTLHRLALEGADVQVIVASDGEKGPNRTNEPDLPAARRREQEAAARVNGYTEVHFLGLPDRGVVRDARFMPEVERIYRDVKPEAVFLFDPQAPALPYLHPDHQPSARAFLKFWRALGPERPPVYLFQTRRPNVAVDISGVISVKAEALARHRSQNGGRSEGMEGSSARSGRLVGLGYGELYRKAAE